MLQFHTWLLVLVSLSSNVSAFYPYHQNSPSSQDPSHGIGKRFYPIQRPTTKPSDSNDNIVKFDIHKVPKQKRNNKFAVSVSNPASYGPNALAIDQDGSDYSYFSSMQFGSKKQGMYMLIDTGSANTWIFGSSCQSSTCNIHNTFGKEDSNTLKTTQETWDLYYGTGEVSGTVATDTVTFANFTVEMGFGLATNASDDFNNYPMDGILGLGRKTSDKLGTPTVMDVLAADGLIASKMIGVHLHRAEDNTKDGELVFGGIDTDKFSGSLAYTKTANNDAWEIPVDDFVVNGKNVNLQGRTAIIDTGTTFLLMPPSDAKALHAMIPGSSAAGEGFTMPCNTNVKLEVKINGISYSISPKDYVGSPSQTGSSTCGSSIIGHQAFGDTQWILGDVFLKNVYTVFDFDGQRIGFGMPGTGGTVSSSSSSSSSPSSTTIMPSSSGTASSSARQSASASASASSLTANTSSSTASGASTSTGSSSSSSARSTSTASDSNIGGGTSESSAGVIVVGYWNIVASICVGFWFSIGVISV